MEPCKECGNILCVCNKPPKAEFLGKPPQPPTATLRDQFACCILNGLMLRSSTLGYTDETALLEAYRLADIMMEVRDGKLERNRGV